MTIEHCRGNQNYIATKNEMKYWKECHDIKKSLSRQNRRKKTKSMLR